ncbi:hypothetical protein ACVMIH_006987 [Bradyrhizobium sp. USDA 4503]
MEYTALIAHCRASPRHRDETRAAHAHSTENHGVSYGFAFTDFDGTFK